MKRIIYSMGLMLMVTFALTDCTKEMNQPQEEIPAGTPFEIVASAVGTRTTNDGIHTDWVAGDAINLFHAPASTTGYVNDKSFTIAEDGLAEGRFKGTLTSGLESGKSYDWYAFYPYKSHTQAPTNNDEDSSKNGYSFIGHSVGLDQDGYDNMSSLAGTVCPLYGIAKNVASDKMPQVTMQHLSSVIALKVTNTIDAPLVIETASFTAPEDIVGQYYISFAGEPAYTPRGEANVKNTAIVNVSNGTELAKDQSAVLYLAIKPFTAKSGDTLYISVNGYEKELPLTKDVTFTAGKIKTVNFAYDYVKTSKEVVFDFNANTWGLPTSSSGNEDAGNIVNPVEVDDVSITVTNGTGTKTRLWEHSETHKTDLRAYNGSSLTFIVPEGYVVKKITITGTAADAAISPNIGSYSSKEWTGNANPLVLDIKGTLNLDTITVEYDLGESDPEKAVQNLSFAEANYTATVGEAFESPVLEGAQTAVTYSSSEESVATVDENGKVTILKEGKTTITATAAENDTYRSAQASYTLTVNEPFPFPWIEDFSAADVISKYTVTRGDSESKIYNDNIAGGEAPEILISKGNGSLTAKIKMNGKYGEMALTLNSNNPGYLSVTSTVAGVEIGKPLVDAAAKTFEVAITVPQGTDVLDLTITNTTSSNARVDNICFNKAKAKQTLSFAETAYSLTVGDAFTAPTVSGAKTDVTYSSDNVDVARVDPSTGVVELGTAGTATITATAAEDDTYRSATASYTITLKPTGGYLYIFESKQFDSNETKELGSMFWTLNGENGKPSSYNSDKGQQFGTASIPYKNMTLSAISSNVVNSITINTSGAKDIKATLIVTVGGTQYGNAVTLTATATDYTFNAPAGEAKSGDIVFTYTQTSSKALYIKKIIIN